MNIDFIDKKEDISGFGSDSIKKSDNLDESSSFDPTQDKSMIKEMIYNKIINPSIFGFFDITYWKKFFDVNQEEVKNR